MSDITRILTAIEQGDQQAVDRDGHSEDTLARKHTHDTRTTHDDDSFAFRLVLLTSTRLLSDKLADQILDEILEEEAEKKSKMLFGQFIADFGLMPAEHEARARIAHDEQGPHGSARAVADYIAGMTDRFALQAHESIGESSR